MIVQPCSATRGDHAGTVHLYPCGWRCDRHAPGPAITRIRPSYDYTERTAS